MLSIIHNIINEGVINNKSSLKIINNEIIDEITIILNSIPIYIYNKINKQKNNIKLISIHKNDILFILNDDIKIYLTNIVEKINKINIYNIQIDLKTKNILNNANEINIRYEDIYEYPIILLEIIQLLCCEKYNIDKNLKTYMAENSSNIFVNFRHNMNNISKDIEEIFNIIDKNLHFNKFLKLITTDYSYIYEIIFGIKYNIELFQIIKPNDIKTLLLFILIDKENFFNDCKNINNSSGKCNLYSKNNVDNYDICNNNIVNNNDSDNNSDDNNNDDSEFYNDDSEFYNDDSEFYNDDNNNNEYCINKLDNINEIKKIKLEMVKMDFFTKKNKFDSNFFIITSYNIIKILTLKNINLSLKIGYIIKNFLNIDIDILKYCVNIYNILSLEKINNSIFIIIYDIKLIKYIELKHLEIPKIVNNFKKNIDSVDIYIFQDCFVLLCEEIYINSDNDDYNEIFERIINNIRYCKKDYVYKLKYIDEKIKYKKLKDLYKLIKKNIKIL